MTLWDGRENMSENTNYWDHPTPPKDFFERVEEQFDQYLFFENMESGKREYTCTACHKSFIIAPLHQKRTVYPEDVDLWRANVNDEAICPKCHKRATVKNIKLMKNVPHQQRCNIAVMVDSPEDVWLICYISFKKEKSGKVDHHKIQFYHLVPGDSYQFKSWGLGDNLMRQKLLENPFTWHHGLWTEQYDYKVDLCGNRLEDTFLKYALELKDGQCYTNKRYFYIPDVKYLCWFARHPQFEFLMKLGHVEVVHEIMEKHSDFKSLLNWEAKKPWDLFNITHEDYKIWKKYQLDFSLYKIFRRLGVHGEKGWKLANDIADMVNGSSWRIRPGDAYKFIAKCKKVNTSPREIVNYINKVRKNSGGGCWHCPGITLHQAYTTWMDYIDMAIGADKLKSISLMPKDLQAAHNQMLGTKKHNAKIGNRNWRDEYNKYFKAGATYAQDINKKFPKIERIYKAIADKFAYENERYALVVPKSVQEVYAECTYLRLCVTRPGPQQYRYWERVSRRESYMMFLRDKQYPDRPFYLIEVEPCGTIRQKRSFDDLQYSDIDDAVEFLKEWQAAIQSRMTSNDRKLAKKSREQREIDLQGLREEKKVVRTGYLTGQLLADVLEADLLEVTVEEPKQKNQKRKVG